MDKPDHRIRNDWAAKTLEPSFEIAATMRALILAWIRERLGTPTFKDKLDVKTLLEEVFNRRMRQHLLTDEGIKVASAKLAACFVAENDKRRAADKKTMTEDEAIDWLSSQVHRVEQDSKLGVKP
jgi:hypothetical protein